GNVRARRQKKSAPGEGALSHGPRSCLRGGRFGGGLRRVDADLVPALVLVLELHEPVDERVDRVIAAEAHVVARVILRTILANDDVAGAHLLAAVLLGPLVFRIAVAAVPRGADALLMCHGFLSQPREMSL